MQDVRSFTAGDELVVSHQSIAQIRDRSEEFDLFRRYTVCLGFSQTALRIDRALDQLLTSFSQSLDSSLHGAIQAISPEHYRGPTSADEVA